ncbi:hypothetical protein A3D80_03915 [Candidatus Roizmanbacteria bacterium RIFCSPHIGHO2_02_FULL_40_13b]|uniref:SpoVT-AbrB domain-containing protein n=1 Tax=Candidatus Roizmanbacteria bacterium RIFCSPHIGHO2_01_FULL_39_24 TaxID=1802032 RepID=A0A1F7GLI1_9BACT|nr:MAG: hypothetical protein A2799_00645 [Candidatus Roizmanbacteria bacterium RIFCSPHIGHO2_01_FULL_39_24]OGK27940.1 MAG: hypothetical protein A3D80_03915 [Candidatus Roizmanbacteria bacterium RIFCSPHIGHO2_02_FULL_40_13b]OGK50071.1 MAG: hypothetical protein A3A56_02150 [Candidatus Roizmanbacteria bacterium RIFCSPLOWO2_01_FULL_40_32]OGK56377.1 MAG: hypothetical protein A3H83_02620 [Candidatus Roizmanbacteria bacterium RIFCSPLOWO2_02_FULL_39_8]
MQYQATVTQKGQITLPQALRDKLGIKKYGKVKFDLKKDHLKVSPVGDFLSYAGKFPITRGKSVLEAREAFEKRYKRV